jgi:hypothetical protein
MPVPPRARLLLGLVAAATVAAPAAASADVVTTRDEDGRPIRIDVQAPDAEVGDYARLLRRAVHGPEIARVLVRIVPEERIPSECRSPRARACYEPDPARSVITVPSGDIEDVGPTVLHEYGHHLDASIRHPRGPELNGTPRWWGTRSMGRRLERGQIATSYRMGWARSAGEIFAEDYVQMHVRSPYAIGWLPRPDETVFRAIRLDVTGVASGPPPRPHRGGEATPVDLPTTTSGSFDGRRSATRTRRAAARG